MDRAEDLVQVTEKSAPIYEAAGVLEIGFYEIGFYAPQWATMIVQSCGGYVVPMHAASMIRALKRARDDEEARRRFVMMFKLCGDTAADRRRCVEEFLL